MTGWLTRLRRLAAKPRLLLALDFDGTLSPISHRPQFARLKTSTGELLQALAQCQGVSLAILSGRSLKDLRKHLRLKATLWVGNHGFESSHPNLKPHSREMGKWKKLIRDAKIRLRPVLKDYPGVWIESKGVSLSLHFRALTPSQWPALLDLAGQTLGKSSLHLLGGKAVLDVRPSVKRNKGWALKRLDSLLGSGTRKCGVIFVGDDATDEDAFRFLRQLRSRGLGIKVGLGPSAALGRLKSPKEVTEMLSSILKLRRSMKQGG